MNSHVTFVRHDRWQGVWRLAALAGWLAIAAPADANPEVPGRPQQRPVALVNATIHPVSGPAIENGTLLFDGGKITAVGRDAAIPDNAQRIDLIGKHVYPALFDAFSEIGLVEIDAVRATLDQQEIGSINPNVKSWVAVNPDSEVIPVTRSNGVLLALTAPRGGLISGSSAVLQLDGWTFEDLTIREHAGMHVVWPSLSGSSGDGAGSQRGVAQLEQVFADARAYLKARAADAAYPVDLRHEALRKVIERATPLIVSAEDLRQIHSAVAFAQRQQVRMILQGGYDAPAAAELLKQQQVPVIVGGVYRLPLRRHDPYDTAYTVPARLQAAGVKYCIGGAGKFGASNVRNLPYHAATAAAFGLAGDEAIKAITLYPAEILGVADRVGSLDVGKEATLIVTTGDPLETLTQVEAAYVQGRAVELNDRHKRLWRKYQEKYRQ